MSQSTRFEKVEAVPTNYTSWRQVAGYFDGDGNVRLDVRKYVLRLGIRFVDTWKPQLEGIRYFLGKKGVKTGAIGLERRGNKRPAYRLSIDEGASVEKAINAMLPLCLKKREDLRIALDYLRNKITGNGAIQRFNEQTAIGRRRGVVRKANLDFTRGEGQRLHELNNARKARDAHRVKVDIKIQDAMRKEHFELGLGETALSRKYKFSIGVVRRVLRESANCSAIN